jgi:hypothetical protein
MLRPPWCLKPRHLSGQGYGMGSKSRRKGSGGRTKTNRWGDGGIQCGSIGSHIRANMTDGKKRKAKRKNTNLAEGIDRGDAIPCLR